MAREGQGLQILLIVFVFFTILLAFGTWWGMSNWMNVADQLKTEKQKVNDLTKERNNYQQFSDALLYTVGEGKMTSDQEFAKAAADLSTDPIINETMTKVKDNFEADMKQYGGDGEGAKNWRSLIGNFLKIISNKNALIAENRKTEQRIEEEKQTATSQALSKEKEADKNRLKAIADHDRDRKVFENDLRKAREDNEKMKQKVALQGQQIVKITNESKLQIAAKVDVINKQATLIEQQKETIRQLRPKEIDVADGRVTFVNHGSRSVYVNLGSADLLRPQLLFGVYPEDTSRFNEETRKAELRVLKILGPHQAEARIVSSSLADPILEGDEIYTPNFTPRRPIKFALAGVFDLDEDGKRSLEELKKDQSRFKGILERKGNSVSAQFMPDGSEDGELDPSIRYLVIGDLPPSKALQTEFKNYRKRAQDIGIEVKYYRTLMEQMGENRQMTVGGKSSGSFKPRRPRTSAYK